MKRRLAIAGFLFVFVLALAPAALAQDPTDDPPVDQYIDEIPTAGGKRGSGGKGSKLSSDLAQQIATEGGSDAAILEQVVTSPSRGAPSNRPDRSSPSRALAGSDGAEVSRREPDAASAVGSALTDDGGAQLGGLVVALAAIGAVAVVAVFWRARRRRA